MIKVKVNKLYLITLIIVILSFSACGGKSIRGEIGTDPARKGQRPVTLKLWHIWAADSESNKKPFEKALSDWNNLNPDIKIEAEATENETYKTRIRTAIAVNEAPDLFYCWGAALQNHS